MTNFCRHDDMTSDAKEDDKEEGSRNKCNFTSPCYWRRHLLQNDYAAMKKGKSYIWWD